MIPQSVESLSQASQAALAAGAGLTVVNSFFSLSSPLAMWMIASQLQLLLLLLLTDTFIPPGVAQVLTQNAFAMFSFDFNRYLKIGTIPYIGWPEKKLDFEQANSELYQIGIESGSTFVSSYGLSCVMLIIIFIHLLLTCVKICCMPKYYIKRNNCFSKFVNFVDKLFGFTIYIRLLVEAHQVMILASFSEIYRWDNSDITKTISLVLAITIMAISTIFFVFSLWMILHPEENYPKYVGST